MSFAFGKHRASTVGEVGFTMSFINKATKQAGSIAHIAEKLSATEWWIPFAQIQVSYAFQNVASKAVLCGVSLATPMVYVFLFLFPV